MKKLILFILLAGFASANSLPFSFWKKAAGSSYADITFYWGMEAATWQDAEYSLGSAAGTIVGSPTQDAIVFKVGTHSMQYNTSSYNVTHPVTSNINHIAGGIGMWFRCGNGSFPSSSNPNGILSLVYDSNNRIFITNGGGGEMRFNYTSGGTGIDITTTGASLSVSTWYFVSYKWSLVSTTLTYDFQIWDGAGTSMIRSTSTATVGAWAGTPTTFAIGEWTGTPGTWNIDNVIVTNAYSRDLHLISTNVFP